MLCIAILEYLFFQFCLAILTPLDIAFCSCFLFTCLSLFFKYVFQFTLVTLYILNRQRTVCVQEKWSVSDLPEARWTPLPKMMQMKQEFSVSKTWISRLRPSSHSRIQQKIFFILLVFRFWPALKMGLLKCFYLEYHLEYLTLFQEIWVFLLHLYDHRQMICGKTAKAVLAPEFSIFLYFLADLAWLWLHILTSSCPAQDQWPKWKT